MNYVLSKKLLLISVIVVAVAFVIFRNVTKETVVPSVSRPRLVFAALLPMTGSGADQAEWIKQGMELALADIKQKEKVDIDMVYEDTAGDVKTAITAYQNVKARYSPPVIFTWGSGVGMGLSPLNNNDKVVQMGVALATPAYSSPDDFTFRTFPSASLEAEFLADGILNKLGHPELVIVKINNDYGVGQAKAFDKSYEARGGKVKFEEGFESGSADFRAIIAKLNASQVKAILLSSYPTEGAKFIKQARELGFTGQIIASVAILGEKGFFTNAGTSAEGLIVSTSVPSFSESTEPSIVNFRDAFKGRFGNDPGPEQLYTARAYDALRVVVSAASTCQKGLISECIKTNLYRIKDYTGASGTVGFDRNGDIPGNFSFQVIKNGKFESLK